MGVIYDIAGTSSDTFMLNGKLTLLQGDNEPLNYQGKNGDVYFQTNGNIWVKVQSIWNNISASSLPRAGDVPNKMVYSNGTYYVATSFNYNDIALKSELNDFKNGATFSGTTTFTSSANFKNGVDVLGATPHIDFHYNNSTSDYTTRLAEDANGVLSITSANNAQNNASNSTTSTSIATKGWVNDPTKSTNVLHRTGDETVDGVKTFKQTIQGTAYRALWGDLAEYYESDKDYANGTLVQFGGEKEITIASVKVNAIITSEPGFILNNRENNGLAIALVGKVPVRIIGKVEKFDEIVLSETLGVGRVKKNDSEKTIAIALETNANENEKLVKCVTKLDF
nr:MAG TPA: Preneck appendage protein [Caudoviricetes sp.]